MEKQFIKTTLYIPIRLHESAKIMAVLTHSNMSKIMCEALKDKIEKLKSSIK